MSGCDCTIRESCEYCRDGGIMDAERDLDAANGLLDEIERVIKISVALTHVAVVSRTSAILAKRKVK